MRFKAASLAVNGGVGRPGHLPIDDVLGDQRAVDRPGAVATEHPAEMRERILDALEGPAAVGPVVVDEIRREVLEGQPVSGGSHPAPLGDLPLPTLELSHGLRVARRAGSLAAHPAVEVVLEGEGRRDLHRASPLIAVVPPEHAPLAAHHGPSARRASTRLLGQPGPPTVRGSGRDRWDSGLPPRSCSASTVSIEYRTCCALDCLIGCVSNPPRGIGRASYAEPCVDVNREFCFAWPRDGVGRAGEI